MTALMNQRKNEPAQRSIPYRADIDGLRGIAILMVVYFHNFELYHLTSTHFGWLGVDIFFVISGYLITSIIEASLDKGTFSFRSFYARRVRRLFPALIAVFVPTLIWGWYALDPFFFQHLGGNIFYGALSLANITFSPKKGFFKVETLLKPFGSLWSLSLEEQFYAVIPALLKWTRPLRAWRAAPFFLLAVISFAIQTQIISSPLRTISTYYYDPLARAWELLLGVILALTLPRLMHIAHALFSLWSKTRTLRERFSLNNILSWLGGYMIVASVLVVNSQKNLPFKTIVVCLGTAFLIAAGPKAWLNAKILSHRWLVAIGLISYPLFIVHWCLVSMTSMTIARNHSAVNFILMCFKDPLIMPLMTLFSVALSALIYRYAEQPLRYSRKTDALCVGMLILSLCGGAAFKKKWTPLTQIRTQK